MASGTHIQWTDATWNPVTGCTKVSAGCKNCYAERLFPCVYGKDAIDVCRSCRGKGCPDCHGNGSIVPVPRRFTDVVCHEGDRLYQPLHWRKPRRVFVNSMSDLFHPDVPDEFIARVFDVMARAPHHQFQVLTKRPERMNNWFHEKPVGPPDPLPNVWLGVSVEDQDAADERVPVLLDTPAAVRFISAEPLLGPVDLGGWGEDWLRGIATRDDGRGEPEAYQTHALDWVIVGGESGPKARPMSIEWAKDIVRQCRDADVPVFVKQLGTSPYAIDDLGSPVTVNVKHRAGADPSEWPEHLRIREYPFIEGVPDAEHAG